MRPISKSAPDAACLAALLLSLLSSPCAATLLWPREDSPPMVSRAARNETVLPWTVTGSCPRPIDYTVEDPLGWAPWTYRPLCLASNRGPERIYCAYTDALVGDCGFSVLSSPETAAFMAGNLPNVSDEPFVSPFFHTHHTQGTDSPYGEEDKAPLWEVTGTGEGARIITATRRIRAHEVIHIDRTAIAVNAEMDVDVQELAKVVYIMGTLMKVDAINGLFGGDNTQMRTEVDELLRPHSFKMRLNGEMHSAQYFATPWFGHSCRPNAYLRQSRAELSLTTIALRDIQAGEEITITHMTAGHVRQRRQEALDGECQCELCTAPPEEIEASDKRRVAMESIFNRLDNWAMKKDPRGAIDITEQALQLIAEEGLEVWNAPPHLLLATAYQLIGDDFMAGLHRQMWLDVLEFQGYGDVAHFLEKAMLDSMDTFDTCVAERRASVKKHLSEKDPVCPVEEAK